MMRYTDEFQTMIEVSAAEGADLGAPNGGFFPVGLFVERGGNLDEVAPWVAAAPDFVSLRAAALHAVFDEVSAARLRRVPGVAYIETEYQMLAQEADAYVLAGYPADATGLEFLTVAAALSGNSLTDEANAIRAKRDAYVDVLRVTYTLRKEAQEAIAAAPDDVSAIDAVKENYIGQLAAI
jgi:hypothetical protein